MLAQAWSWIAPPGGAGRRIKPAAHATGGSVATSRDGGRETTRGRHTSSGVGPPGLGKTKTGRLWTYVRDDRPAGDSAPAAVWFAYSPDRKGEHPQSHLRNFTGTLQADAYAGFERDYC